MTFEWQILLLGLLLGVRHAFDADHLVAVTTIVSEYRNPLRAIWIGVSWGLGHTSTLLLAGTVLLLLNVHIPERLALFFEFLVGVMLIVLGIQTFRSFRQRKVHIHPHHHDTEPMPREHFHSHDTSDDHTHPHPGRWEKLSKLLIAGVIHGEHTHGAPGVGRPFFRLKSYLVGTVHGLAGSAALMLLVLATIKSVWHGIAYILIFGLGTVVSMGLISIFISLPFSISGRMPRLHVIIQTVAGIVSILFGLVLMYEVGITEGLLVGS
ncbi:MAG: sulfite exporter TauE/SafE family protein [Chloroflexi bacterium]|nr:sulfite exporter TauE/SafE family protein [Chloroflexota bacterium]